MTRTRLGALLVVLGAVVLVLSLFADPIGIGSGGSGFGWKQTAGVVVGAIVALLGLIVFVRARGEGEEESPEETA